MMKTLLFLSTLTFAVDAYFLMGLGTLMTERRDPIVSPGPAAGSHVHRIAGGSNFDAIPLTTAALRKSECTTTPINEDKSAYWFPQLFFQWQNGSFTSLGGGPVVYYLFDSPPPNNFQVFPDDFRMISGDPSLRTYNASSFAQQAVTFRCLDFNGVTTTHDSLPLKQCPSGIRSQVNFPSCWNGKDLDSPNHKSHVAFPSGGPDKGTCSDPNYPVTLPRIFMEVYWDSGSFYPHVDQAMNKAQPFVFSNGDPTGFGYHGDFFNGWKKGTLLDAVQKCSCTIQGFGDIACCANAGVFTFNKTLPCTAKPIIQEQVEGTLDKLPGNNPVTTSGSVAAPPPPAAPPASSSSKAAAPVAPTSAPPVLLAPGPSSPPSMPSPSPPAADPADPSHCTGDHPHTSSPTSADPNTTAPAPAGSVPSGNSPSCPAQVTTTVTVTVTVGNNPPTAPPKGTPPNQSAPPKGTPPNQSAPPKGTPPSPSVPHNTPSPDPNQDPCEVDHPSLSLSPTPKPTTPARRQVGSFRARHNAGRRFHDNSF